MNSISAASVPTDQPTHPDRTQQHVNPMHQCITIDGEDYSLNPLRAIRLAPDDQGLFFVEACRPSVFGDKPVMIKLCKASMLAQGLHEAQLLAQLIQTHRQKCDQYLVNVIRFSPEVQFDQTPCCALVMEAGKQTLEEFVQAASLDQIHRHATLIVRHIAQCLHYLHSVAGVVHGNLRLENVVDVGTDGVDFRLANLENSCRLTKSVAMRWRSPEYCPPEMAVQIVQRHGHDHVEDVSATGLCASGSLDVWSFGVVWIKYLLKGQVLPEFRTMTSPQEIMERLAQPDFSFAQSLATLRDAKVAPAMVDLIQACVGRDPSSRPTFYDICKSTVLNGANHVHVGIHHDVEPEPHQALSAVADPPTPPSTQTSAWAQSIPHLGELYSICSERCLDDHHTLVDGTEGFFHLPVMIKIYHPPARAQFLYARDTFGRVSQSGQESNKYVVVVRKSYDQVLFHNEICSALVMERGEQNLQQVAQSLTRAEAQALVVATMQDVAEGLHFLHSQVGLVHGEVCLGNVVNFGLERPQWKLIDFDKACNLNETMTVDRDTMNAEYCPPELAVDLVHQRSCSFGAAASLDVYRFGVQWMKFLLNGRVLTEFADLPNDKVQLLTRISDPTFTFDQTLQELGMVGPMRDLIRACTHRDPSKRPSAQGILRNAAIYATGRCGSLESVAPFTCLH